MSREITRDLIRDRLGRTTYDRFLLYLMGPYKSFDLNYVLTDEERAAGDVEDLPGPIRKFFRNRDAIDGAKALLRRVQGHLRSEPGVNAFLAVDVETYETESELGDTVRRFVVTTMNRERFGDLEHLG